MSTNYALIALKQSKEKISLFAFYIATIGAARIFDWEWGKSPIMMSSEVFKRGTFCGEKIS